MWWGPVLGWAWVMGKTYEDHQGFVVPQLCYDEDNNEWKKIADDALEGIANLCAMYDIQVEMSDSSAPPALKVLKVLRGNANARS